jgi:hypothetical protein
MPRNRTRSSGEPDRAATNTGREPPGSPAPAPRPPDASGLLNGFRDYPVGVLLFAFMVIGVVLALRVPIDPHDNPDSWAFEGIARSLLGGQGLTYREPMFHSILLYAFRSPGYPTFLAVGLLLGGLAAALALQGALNGVSAVLVGAIAGRAAGVRAAWIAFAIRLVWPTGWLYSGQLLSESLFEFTMVLSVWLALCAADRRSLRWAGAAGAAVAFAVLTRPIGLGVAAALAVWLLLRFPRGMVAMTLAALLVWVPWPIRNAVRLHAFVPFATSGGVTLWGLQFDQAPIVSWNYMARHAELGELGLDRYFTSAALQGVRDHPGRLLVHCLKGAFNYLGPLKTRAQEFWLHRFAMLAALPALVAVKSRRQLALPALVWILEGVLFAPTAYNSARFRFPTEWCAVVAAAVGLEAVAERHGVRRMVAFAASGLLACVVFTLAVRA